MPARINSARRTLALVLLALALVASAQARASAQNVAQDDPDRQHAFELFANQQFADAAPLLEKLATKYPSDGQVLARLGISVFANSVSISDTEKRQKERARARTFPYRPRPSVAS